MCHDRTVVEGADGRSDGAAVGLYAVYRALGIVLLSAAALKTLQAATDSGAPVWLTRPWVSLLLVEFEIALGCWLFTGLKPALTWLVTSACFLCFAIVAFARGIAGDASCACFGKASPSPWVMVILDSVALLALWAYRPTGRIQAAPSGPQSVGGAGFFLLSLVLGIFAAAIIVSRPSTPLLLASPPAVNFGQVTRGKRVAADFWLDNQGDRPVDIGSIETSCDCVQVDLPSGAIPAGHKAPCQATVTLDSESEFVGALSIQVTGRTGSGGLAFVLEVNARVE